MSTRAARPCKLPKIQIDTWQASEAASTPCCADTLAQAICKDRLPLLVHSLLTSVHGEVHQLRIADYVRLVHRAHMPLQVYTSCGQLYLNKHWRLRYGDMDDTLKKLILSSHSPLQSAFQRAYQADKVVNMLYDAIGPARKEGTQTLLRLRPRPE